MYWLSKIMGAALTPIRNLLYWISRAIPGLARLGRLSLALRYALLTFVFLLIVGFALYYRFSIQDQRAGLRVWFGEIPWLVVLLLLIAIPVCVYFLVRLLQQGTVSRFPDIDAAWQTGLAQLRAHGIELTETPLFLVLGTADAVEVQSLIQAAQLDWPVKLSPEGPAALHWTAGPGGILLFVTDSCCLSLLAQSAASESPAPAVHQVAQGRTGHTGTLVMGGTAGGGDAGIQGTIVQHQAYSPTNPSSAAMGGAPASVMATMQVGQPSSFALPGQPVQTTPAKSVLKPADINRQCARLDYVCHLIRRTRGALCPINGALAVIPFSLIETSADQVQVACQRDLAVMHQGLPVRCPVSVLVSRMDQLDGFREMVRRVGMERAKEQRFGKGFDVWTPPSERRLRALAQNACGAFEDWTYMLFREADVLRKPGNTKLFSLLCRVRGSFAQALEQVLAYGFGNDVDGRRGELDESFLFSGCYFAATGASPDRQAFVKSVVHKVLEQEYELDWREDALRQNEVLLFASHVLALIGLAALVALGYLVVRQVWFTP